MPRLTKAETSERMQEAKDMQSKGVSVGDIAKHFTVSKRAVYKWLKTVEPMETLTDADFELPADEHIKEPWEYRKPGKWSVDTEQELSNLDNSTAGEYSIDPPLPMSDYDTGYFVGFFEGLEIGRTMSISHPIHQNRVEAERYMEIKEGTALDVPAQSAFELDSEKWRQRPATQAQKDYCIGLLNRAGVTYNEIGIERLTQGGADRIIKTYKR